MRVHGKVSEWVFNACTQVVSILATLNEEIRNGCSPNRVLEITGYSSNGRHLRKYTYAAYVTQSDRNLSHNM